MCQETNQYSINDQLEEVLRKDNLKELIDYLIKNSPEYIYKYVSLGTGKDELKLQSLNSSTLYFSNKTKFDDKDREYENIEYLCKTKSDEEIKNQYKIMWLSPLVSPIKVVSHKQ